MVQFFAFQRPHIFLEPFIQGYLVLKVEAEVPVDEFLTAKPYSALAFFVNSKFKGQQQNVIFETSLSFRPEKIHLGGMLGKNIKWRIGGYGYLIYAIFTSTGLCHFMRENAGAALNTFVILDELNLKNDYEYLEEQIQLAECPIKAVQLIDNYLLNHFNKLKIPFSVKDMSPVTAYINRQKGIINMKQLEEKFRVSRRWLEKEFATQVGFSPKEFANIVRFKTLVTSMSINPNISLLEASDIFGYHDPSHLIHDFQNFTGESPTAFFKTHVTGINKALNQTA